MTVFIVKSVRRGATLQMQNNRKAYVLVTAARNEEEFIHLPIKSVVSQTIKPSMWIIVSDRSTDRTDQIITEYAKEHPFIRLVRNEKSAKRNTAAKVHAISMGLKLLAHIDYGYIGNLDGDVSFGETYFESLLEHFENDKKLGVAGGRIFQVSARGAALESNTSTESVAGAVQFFRRECFDQIGGYRPISGGMEDGVAEITARYYGWRTRSFRELPVLHHREVGTVGRSVWQSRFNSGVTEYAVGFSFIYHLIRAFSRISERPYVIGSVLVMFGYLWAMVSRRPTETPGEIAKFMRQEQMARLFGRLLGKVQR
jgi:glycosyltransferase involved in cell wall biosynthesis